MRYAIDWCVSPGRIRSIASHTMSNIADFCVPVVPYPVFHENDMYPM